MKGITFPNAHDHAKRIHARLAGCKTRCGISIKDLQEDFASVNCVHCLKSLSRSARSVRRRINGPRMQRGQLKFEIA